jgi:hypothetical protein
MEWLRGDSVSSIKRAATVTADSREPNGSSNSPWVEGSKLQRLVSDRFVSMKRSSAVRDLLPLRPVANA